MCSGIFFVFFIAVLLTLVRLPMLTIRAIATTCEYRYHRRSAEETRTSNSTSDLSLEFKASQFSGTPRHSERILRGKRITWRTRWAHEVCTVARTDFVPCLSLVAAVAFTLALFALRPLSVEAKLDPVYYRLLKVRVWTTRALTSAAKEAVTPTFELKGRRTAFTFAPGFAFALRALSATNAWCR